MYQAGRKLHFSRPTALFLAVITPVLAGAGYRIATHRLKNIIETAIRLPVALNTIPITINGWVGKNIPIDKNIQRVMANDDFINRLYKNKSTGKWANVYLAYSARPRTMLGHRPDVCYPANGWIHDVTKTSQLTLRSGKTIPVLIHRFHMPPPAYEEIVVINYYIVNGRITATPKGFSGLGWRTPNIAGNTARYVAQVQISSIVENSARPAARDITDLILDFLPDKNGTVKALDYSDRRADSTI